MICAYGAVRRCDIADSNLKFVNKITDEKSLDTKAPSIDDIVRTTVFNSYYQNTELCSRFAQSLVKDRTFPIESKPNDHHTDLTSFPSSWTEYLMSPHKDHAKQLLHASEPPIDDILDLDQQTVLLKNTHTSPVPDKCFEWVIPVDMPIDIRVKIALCIIQLKLPGNMEVLLLRPDPCSL